MPAFDTEAAMCAVFCDWVKRQGWTPYAEWGGFDVLLVHPDGTQIGVQAKLRFNLKVLDQILPEDYEAVRDCGPDFRAVLVPSYAGVSEKLLSALGIKVIVHRGYGLRVDFSPRIDRFTPYERWHFWNPLRRVELPPYVPDVVAGASGPVQLTEWKIAALRVVALLDLRGYVTRADFRCYGIDPRRWLSFDHWLLPGSSPGQFVKGPGLRIAEQHPVVFGQIRAEIAAELDHQELPSAVMDCGGDGVT